MRKLELINGFLPIEGCSVDTWELIVGKPGEHGGAVPLAQLRDRERPFPFRAMRVGQSIYVPKWYMSRGALTHRATRVQGMRFTVSCQRNDWKYEVCRIE